MFSPNIIQAVMEGIHVHVVRLDPVAMSATLPTSRQICMGLANMPLYVRVYAREYTRK